MGFGLKWESMPSGLQDGFNPDLEKRPSYLAERMAELTYKTTHLKARG